MKIRQEVSRLERQLRAAGSPDRAVNEKRYLKSDLEFLGVPTPAIRSLVKTWLREHPGLEHEDLTRLARELWRRRLHELRACAIVLLQARTALLEPGDIDLLESMLRRSKTWAYVDAIAVHVVGPLVERFPELETALERWAVDDDFWIDTGPASPGPQIPVAHRGPSSGTVPASDALHQSYSHSPTF